MKRCTWRMMGWGFWGWLRVKTVAGCGIQASCCGLASHGVTQVLEHAGALCSGHNKVQDGLPSDSLPKAWRMALATGPSVFLQALNSYPIAGLTPTRSGAGLRPLLHRHLLAWARAATRQSTLASMDIFSVCSGFSDFQVL